MRSRSLAAILAAGCLVPATVGFGQLRVVSWNTAGSPHPGTDVVLEAIGAESVNGIAKPIDVLILQEQTANHGSENAIVALLNALYGAGTYAHGTHDPWSNDGTYEGLVYNTQTVTRVEETSFHSAGQSRETGRYRLRPAGYGPAADVYVYNTHYKAGTSSSDRLRRANEARAVRWDTTYGSDYLPAQANVIYAGDYNMRYSTEDAVMTTYDGSLDNPYQYVLRGSAPWPTSGNGQGADPIGRPGNWHDNPADIPIHTQNPSPGFVGGGMDDRFDFQLISTDAFDGEGISYIGPGVGDIAVASHSYRAFANNGTHDMNGTISSGSGAAPAVLAALETASDHLPVVADFQLPARMGVSVEPAPAAVIVGASVSVDVQVANTAAVVAACGADELDYTLSTTDDLSGSAGATDAALGGGNTHAVGLGAPSAGTRGGQVNVTSSSQAVADGSFSQWVFYTVLDHSEASFDAGGDLDELTIDLGGCFLGGGPRSVGFEIHNLPATADYTADLAIGGAAGAGDTGRLYTDVAATPVTAGTGAAFNALLETAATGTFSSVWTISVSDEDLPGASAGAALTLTLSGRVTVVGDFDFDTALDADDIDLMHGALGGPDLLYDLDGDDDVDRDDADKLVRDVFGTQYGDADLDGAVSYLDLGVLSTRYGQTGAGWADGDFGGNGRVDYLDLGVMATHYGWPGGGGAVPEPSALILCAASLAALLRAPRRRAGAK